MDSNKKSRTTLTTTLTRIEQPRRRWAVRFIWLVFVLIAITTYVIGLPTAFEFVTGSDSLIYESVLNQLGLSRELFALYFVAIDTLLVAIGVGLGIVIFRQRSDDWMAVAVSITLILTTVAATPAPNMAVGDFDLRRILSSVNVVVLISLLYVFPQGQFDPKWTRWLVFIGNPLLLFVLLFREPVSLLPDFAVPSLVYTVIVFGFLLVGMGVQLYRYRRIYTPLQRQQTKWVLLGFVAFLVGYIVFTQVPLLFPELTHSRAMGTAPENVRDSLVSMVTLVVTWSLLCFAQTLLVVSLGLSILRFRLWEIDLVINRSLVYGLVAAGLFALFVLEALVINQTLRDVLGEQVATIVLVVAVFLTGVLFNPMRKRIQHVIDRRLYGFRFDLNELNKAAKAKPAEIKNPGILTGIDLGGYDVRGVLGRGAMGEVYEGQSPEGRVAIKTLPENLAEQEEFVKRFMREATVLEGLDCAFIVHVYGHGEVDGVHYMIMEFIDGHELKVHLRQHSPLSIEDTLDILNCLTTALMYIHEREIVHRDLKPSNVMLRLNDDQETYQAVLMDFGIARIPGALTSLTGTGAVGTIDYMAPEQIQEARTVDHRADIYALGVMLYEMLTGELPFSGNPGQVLFAHIQQPAPDPRDRVPDMPRPVAKAILKALEKDPADRFESVYDLMMAFTA